MSPSATFATQSDGRCHQVPRLPRKVKVDVTKCHACHGVVKLCGDKLCVSKLCVVKLCVSKLCVSKLYMNKLCVSKLYVDKLCVSELYVCVDHLYRCKTSIRYFGALLFCYGSWFSDFIFMQGGSARLTDTAQRRHCQFVVIQSLISSAYLHQFFISLNGNRLSQVPACRFVSISS